MLDLFRRRQHGTAHLGVPVKSIPTRAQLFRRFGMLVVGALLGCWLVSVLPKLRIPIFSSPLFTSLLVLLAPGAVFFVGRTLYRDISRYSKRHEEDQQS